MLSDAHDDTREGGPCRMWAALAVAFVGAVVIWVWTPLNNFILGNAYLSDSYLPVAALFLLLVLVLVVNPLLRPAGWALGMRAPALVLGIWLVASVVPSSGLLRQLPYVLAGLEEYYPESVPAIPLDWKLGRL